MNDAVTWQIASFAIVVVCLIVGFVWYERNRPPARVAAAIATLAAFAVVGRIAFAPFPNVKPTTDIVLIAGYCLGGAPGFMTGALAGLVSNFYFGQGPWTPWQMIAWGLVGMIGAGAGRLMGRRPYRFRLALVCAASALAFGLVMNISDAILLTGRVTAETLGVTYARALPFDVAHVLGNFAFCMVAGPTLVRMLARLKRRSSLEWPASPPALDAGEPGLANVQAAVGR